MSSISFPGFNISNINIDPVLFKIFSFPIYWYAVIITVGLLLAFIYVMKVRNRFDLTEDNIFDTVIIGVPCAIIGARLYYVIFKLYDFESFKEIINIRQGGLAIYGGIIGVILSTFIYAKIKKVSIASLFDVGALGLLIGQAIGRWGNFINQEAYGSVTDLPWRMGLYTNGSSGYQEVHPTFLYESLWNVIGFILLHIYSKKSKKRFKGEIALLYVAWYGIGRGLIEGLRTDSLMLGEMRISQVLGFLSALIAIVVIAFIKYKNKDKYLDKEPEISNYVKMFDGKDIATENNMEIVENEEIEEKNEQEVEVEKDDKDN